MIFRWILSVAPPITTSGRFKEDFAQLPFGMARGERRPLRVPVQDASAELVERDGHRDLQVAFALPRGCFATAVLRELLLDAIWFQER